jgi:hypothetical protein
MTLFEEHKRRNVFLALMVLGQYEQALAFDLGGYPRFEWADHWAVACRRTPEGYDCGRGDMP